MSRFIPFIIIMACFSAFSQTTISGDISGMTFRPSGNPWVVKENIFIESGNKTVIKSGCVFLFKPFTGIIVQGSLEVDGQPEMPVVFSSINDTLYNNEASVQNPEPFDWNGIIIEKTAENIKMAGFVLSYSVYGLKSKKDNIVLDRGIFRQNGQFHFTINDKIRNVISNVPFNYNINQKTSDSCKAVSGSWKKPTGVISVAIGAPLLGAMGYFIYSASGYDKDYRDSDNRDDIVRYSKRRDDAMRNSIITGIIGGILVPTGTGLLIWEHNTGKRGKKVSFYPAIDAGYGFQIVMKF